MGPICKCSSMDVLRVIEVLSCGTLPQSHKRLNIYSNSNTYQQYFYYQKFIVNSVIKDFSLKIICKELAISFSDA